jgi:hypothetical protein
VGHEGRRETAVDGVVFVGPVEAEEGHRAVSFAEDGIRGQDAPPFFESDAMIAPEREVCYWNEGR